MELLVREGWHLDADCIEHDLLDDGVDAAAPVGSRMAVSATDQALLCPKPDEDQAAAGIQVRARQRPGRRARAFRLTMATK
ncbi:hypothetical protein [Streptomyces sp. NPDC006552]|uniref:hypothetical protein n=1 Tax=Streptomyces sp. NPDC006552 TaxID=3157179 RepID=UPI0033A6AB16